jgi:hypothetical protein
MTTKAWLLAAATLAAVSFRTAGASADTIFDNTVSGNQGITTTGAPQLGDEVTAAPGTGRAVTELDIGFTSQGISLTADLQAFLYANDGAGGSPGTLLWQSAVMAGVNLNTNNELIAFSVPSVVVPDTFTFTSAITNESGAVGWVPSTGTPTTGTVVNPWVGGPGPGSWSTLPSPNFLIEGQVIATAVPEPSSLALCGLGLAGVAALKRARRRAASAR